MWLGFDSSQTSTCTILLHVLTSVNLINEIVAYIFLRFIGVCPLAHFEKAVTPLLLRIRILYSPMLESYPEVRAACHSLIFFSSA